MGQKVNPKAIRLGMTLNWSSRWFSKKDFPALLKADVQIKRFLRIKLKEALVASIEIERFGSNVTIIIAAAKPGLIIGRAGAGIEDLKKEIVKMFFTGKKVVLNINIQEIKKPYLNSQIVVQNMIFDIEKRIPFRRVMKQTISRVQKEGAQGVKVMIGGRLNGAEIARQEMLSAGKIPLQTLRADIDYARGAAFTTYGAIGIKVWIYKGEVFNKDAKNKPDLGV
ncbi:30S ribosomal protein S3 [Candidatus Uhrbacteria bacterium]|nr:30S ribosomal protein S3 [Candidatus Uhrbacteria bacterium]